MKFTDLQLHNELKRALQELNYEEPTPIQKQAIPPGLKGQDVLGIARTGSGKTAAFLLPILQRLNNVKAKPRKPKALIIAPTRELAIQITKSATEYGKYVSVRKTIIYGGVSQKPQVKDLRKGVELVVATPGRLLDLRNQGHIDFSDIDIFVLDEADRMLDMGFLPPVKKMIKQMPNNRQLLFFSATFSKQLKKLANKLSNNPVHVDVSSKEIDTPDIEENLLFVNTHNKKELLKDVLNKDGVGLALVFTRTKRNTDKVNRYLKKHGYSSTRIHGDRSQRQRRTALNKFTNKEVRILVATDVAARGIDVDDVTHVINYELPQDSENYVHRIGRTGRAGNKGVALSLCAHHEVKRLKKIERLVDKQIPHKTHRFHSAKVMRKVR